MMTHQLKIWPTYYEDILWGRKTFELRKNDREFKINDYLRLQEWDNEKKEYTGRSLDMKITYILYGPLSEEFGLKPGYCIMGIELPK